MHSGYHTSCAAFHAILLFLLVYKVVCVLSCPRKYQWPGPVGPYNGKLSTVCLLDVCE